MKRLIKIDVKKWVCCIVPILVLSLFWLSSAPTGLTVQGWHTLGIFSAVILAILMQPLPSGAIMIVGLCVSIITGTFSQKQALAGFSSGIVWLIFSAYILSLSFVQTGLGRRFAFAMLSKFGGSALGMGYVLGIADLLIAPATPSVTARSGGIILPIVNSINSALGSEPGESGKKIGEYLILTCFHITPITGALFLTGMAANPLAVSLASSTLNVDIGWLEWFWAASIPLGLCFILLPALVYQLAKPTMKKTPQAKQMGKDELAKLGHMSKQEKYLVVISLLALLGWGTSLVTGLSSTTVGLTIAALIFIANVIDWKIVLKDSAAWDTLIWFGAIISLASGLSEQGVIGWMTSHLSTQFSNDNGILAFVVLGLVYVYIHYFFATATGHVAALYPMFIAIAVTAGAPPVLVAIGLGILGNLMWGLTEYGGGPGPLYYAQGFFSRPQFYRYNLYIVTVNVLITLVIGLIWWKVIGLW